MLFESLFAKSLPGEQQFERIIRELDGGRASNAAGMSVTADTANSISTYFACIRIISDAIAQCPINVVRKVRDGSTEIVGDHPLALVLDRPNEWQSPAEYFGLVASDVVAEGNHLSEKVMRGGVLRELSPLSWSGVSSTITELDRLRYTYTDPNTAKTGDYTHGQVAHLRGVPSRKARGFVGLSTFRHAHELLGQSLAQREYNSSVYSRGAVATGVFTHPAGLNDEAFGRLSDQLDKKWTGIKNMRRPMLLEGGLEYQTISQSAQDLQLIEGMKYTKEAISEFFGVPLFLLNATDKQTSFGSGIEHLSIGFTRFTVQPIAARIQQGNARSCLSPSQYSEFSVRFDLSALQRGDFKSEQEGLAIEASHGALSVNEWRAFRGRSSIGPGGDTYNRAANLYGPDEGASDEI